MSCAGGVDDLFSEGASQRMEHALAKYRQILTSAPNGWIGDYYPETNYRIGGYAMFFSFDANGDVTISCEAKTKVDPGVEATSQWELIAEQGPVLSFLSLNPVLHYFSSPSQSDVNGMQGDFEFVVANATSDVVELIGKRNKNKLFLRNNKDNLVPADYYAEIPVIEDNHAEYLMFSLKVNNEVLGYLATVDRTFEAEMLDDTLRDFSFCYTPNGFRLAYPYEVNGVKIQNFVLDKENARYTCTDPGVTAVIQSDMPPYYELPYENFIGKWQLNWINASNAKVSAQVDIVFRRKNLQLLMTSPDVFSYDGLILSFRATRGFVSIMTQREFKVANGNYVWTCIWDSGGYLYTTLGGIGGLIGIWDKNEVNPTITFLDNGGWGNRRGDGLALYLNDGVSSTRNTFNGNPGGNRFRNISMTKITE
ncbi:MAG: DUF4302 domain-containing protein [Alistipes sp.]|jgi:hypothetical protein|nr:DUF4302 domain-containing protein [Alistipes sp.]